MHQDILSHLRNRFRNGCECYGWSGKCPGCKEWKDGALVAMTQKGRNTVCNTIHMLLQLIFHLIPPKLQLIKKQQSRQQGRRGRYRRWKIWWMHEVIFNWCCHIKQSMDDVDTLDGRSWKEINKTLRDVFMKSGKFISHRSCKKDEEGNIIANYINAETFEQQVTASNQKRRIQQPRLYA